MFTGGAFSAAFLTSSVFFALSSSLIQVYVSYDYGYSFKKISEKLNFGVGNSSDAVIAQFYHSPADNKRVRKRCPTRCDFLGLDSIRDDCSAKGGLAEGLPCHVFAPWQ